MPIRVWRCPQCGYVEDYLERKKGDKPEECSNCGNKELVLVPTRFNLVVR